MIYNDEGKIFVPAPEQNSNTMMGLQGVWLLQNEDVEWVWQFNSNGTKTLVGYNIIDKFKNNNHENK